MLTPCEARDLIATVAREAAEVVRPFAAGGARRHALDVRWKDGGGTTSPVTEADMVVDRFLLNRLTAAVPGVGWLSEETVDDAARLGRGQVFVVDPIDGTRSFIAGKPDWSISIALVEDGRPIAAGVMVPVTGELYLAALGAGATRDGRPIRATDAATLAGARIDATVPQFEALKPRLGDAVKADRTYSLALRLARVADGTVDIALAAADAADWDLAAADLLVHEAGGVVSTHEGRPLAYNRPRPVHGALVAAGSSRHRALLSILATRPQAPHGPGRPDQP